jgi:hypothetical protein
MNSPTILSALLTSAVALVGQQDLRIAGFVAPNSDPSEWGEKTEAAQAAVRYDELAGEHTLLFVHTTVDPSVAGQVVADGITKALPFMASPIGSNWTLAAPELVAMTGYQFSGMAPMIPPRRIANHIAQFAAANFGAGYGSYNPATTGFVEVTTAANMVATPTSNEDERQPWANSIWATQTSIGGVSFDTAQLGRAGIIQSAYEYVSFVGNLPPIDAGALQALNDLLDTDLGFEIYVQAAHIKPATSGPGYDIRLTRHARIRRLSLLQLEGPWLAIKGKARHVPHPCNAEANIYLAPRGDEMHIVFATAVGTLANPTTLRAYVPTSSGVAIVDQTANPILLGVLLRPEVGIFQCPPGMITGVVQFEQVSNPGIAFPPLGPIDRGAYIFPFTTSQ